MVKADMVLRVKCIKNAWDSTINWQYLAVCCIDALRNVSGWKSSDRSNVSLSMVPCVALSSQVCVAIALKISPRRYCIGSSGPSHFSSHVKRVYNRKNNQSYSSNQVKGVYNKKKTINHIFLIRSKGSTIEKNNQSYFSNRVKGVYNKKTINHMFLTMSRESTIEKSINHIFPTMSKESTIGKQSIIFL
jgi:hypothetical protein